MANPTPTQQAPDPLYVEPVEVPVDHAAEEVNARRLAERYQIEFLDLEHFHPDHALFRSIPADLMLRYGFVPYRKDGPTLVIVVSDPSDLQTIDEVGVQLNTAVRVAVGRNGKASSQPNPWARRPVASSSPSGMAASAPSGCGR